MLRKEGAGSTKAQCLHLQGNNTCFTFLFYLLVAKMMNTLVFLLSLGLLIIH
jgi:hypothetical protein